MLDGRRCCVRDALEQASLGRFPDSIYALGQDADRLVRWLPNKVGEQLVRMLRVLVGVPLGGVRYAGWKAVR